MPFSKDCDLLSVNFWITSIIWVGYIKVEWKYSFYTSKLAYKVECISILTLLGIFLLNFSFRHLAKHVYAWVKFMWKIEEIPLENTDSLVFICLVGTPRMTAGLVTSLNNHFHWHSIVDDVDILCRLILYLCRWSLKNPQCIQVSESSCV